MVGIDGMNGEPKETSTLRSTDDLENAIKWFKEHGSLTVATVALCVAIFSAFNSKRSADAAIISASAAKTNADWASYQRNPNHDVVARVLKLGVVLRDYSPEDTNGFAYVDLALINNGNQTEIIRRVTFYYAENEMADDGPFSPRVLNSQLVKGDKQVLHLLLDRSAFKNKNFWLKVGVTAIGPNAEDLESKWLVAKLSLASDGNGGTYSEYPTNAIRVISNERLPHQRPAELPFL
jgi:hypothetical protein